MLGTREAAIECVKTIDFSFQITINIPPHGFDNGLNEGLDCKDVGTLG